MKPDDLRCSGGRAFFLKKKKELKKQQQKKLHLFRSMIGG